EETRGDAGSALARAKETEGLEFVEAKDETALREALKDAALIVDAVVGTGFKPPLPPQPAGNAGRGPGLRGLAAVARDIIAAIRVPVVAVDLPSGWDADSTAQTSADESGLAQAFRADAVVTFVARNACAKPLSSAEVCAVESASHPLGRSTATTGTRIAAMISRATDANPRSPG